MFMLSLVGCLLVLAGCPGTDMSRWWDPSAVVDSEREFVTQPIIPGLTPADYPSDLVPNAEFPREGDYKYIVEDYRIGPGDVLDIEILDLYETGMPAFLRKWVSTTGHIDLPMLPQIRIKAEGLTREELRDQIADAYRRSNILRTPVVSVTITADRRHVFSVMGAVARPGQYPIPRPDMTLLEALATAGDIIQSNIRYIYVIRPTPGAGRTSQQQPAPQGNGTGGELPPLPQLPQTEPSGAVDPAQRELQELLGGEGNQGAQPAVMPRLSQNHDAEITSTSQAACELKALTGGTKLLMTADGKIIRVPADSTVAGTPIEDISALPVGPLSTQPSEVQDPWGWGVIEKADLARVIAIDLLELRRGNPRMNIVIHDNDIVQVPVLERGEFYVTGEVNRPGVYDLTGRYVTVKQAIVAAGGLGVLSWPKNVILIRRIGNTQEQIFPLNVEAMYHGEENDIFLKANDILAVGQSVWSPFIIVIRNAFRLTYGFGFIYDRNFGDPYTLPLDSRRFTRW